MFLQLTVNNGHNTSACKRAQRLSRKNWGSLSPPRRAPEREVGSPSVQRFQVGSFCRMKQGLPGQGGRGMLLRRCGLEEETQGPRLEGWT